MNKLQELSSQDKEFIDRFGLEEQKVENLREVREYYKLIHGGEMDLEEAYYSQGGQENPSQSEE